MHSGMMHLATAVGLPCTIIINFPTIERLYTTPQVYDCNDKIEWEKQWLYPQHRYLHEDTSDPKYSITIENLDLIKEHK